MTKILFLMPALSEGGAEKVLGNLVNNMDRSRFDITVQTIENCDPRPYLAQGIRYKAINRCRNPWGKKLFSYWFRLLAQMKLAYPLFIKGDYDVEVAYLETSPTKLIAQSTNAKAVKLAWVHCDLSRKEGMAAAAEALRQQYRQFDRIICVSEDTKAGFERLLGENYPTMVLHNVIDEDEIFEKAAQPMEVPPSDGLHLLAVGRLTEQKNFAHLVDACAALKAEGHRFHLDILGEGPERSALEGQIQALGLEDTVTLRGFTPNPYPWMRRADLVVCSSRYEGISTVVQEALLLGKAVVTTPCTGMRELLGDSEYGLIAPDTENGLREAIAALLRSEEHRASYEAAALERGKSFRKAHILAETQGLFTGNFN